MSAETGGTESLGIVFLHHRVDEVTANNLQSFRDWNPHATIVTVSAEEPFPGGYSIRDFPRFKASWERQSCKPGLRARSADLLLYAWYLHRREQCDRWLVVEWDAFCAMPVVDFFAATWEFDFVVPNVCWQTREPEWYWFQHIGSLPAGLQPFATGISPFCFLLARDAVLRAVCERVPWDCLGECNSDLRMGTLAYACGFVPVANPLSSWNITSQPLPETTPVDAGMWHPVKWLAPRGHKESSGRLSGSAITSLTARLRTRTEIINWLIGRQSYGSYLEIGVGDGAHFRAVRCLDKESVDPAEAGEYAGAMPTHRMTSDEFFARNTRHFDLIFIDGLHHSDVAYRDLCNALHALNPDGMVVCHDLNPTSEEMQRVPRQAANWTGDCWKAWVRLRKERPELPMVVANTDYGVGIIFPKANTAYPLITPGDAEMTWTNFDRERRTWLNLVPPGLLGEVLFGDREAEDGLTIVTLWRSDWNPVQTDLLRWMVSEPLPVGTRFVWMAPEGSATEVALEKAWVGFEARELGYTCDYIPVPAVAVQSNVEKHHLVAALYDEALKGVRSEWVIFVEDDVIPAVGGAERLMAGLQAQPLDTASIAAAYRRREQPEEVCATNANWVYFPGSSGFRVGVEG